MLIRQLYDKEPLVSLIITFALALMIEALLRLSMAASASRSASRHSSRAFYLWGPVLITKYRLAVFVTTVVLLIGAVGVPAVHPVRPHPARGFA